MIVLPILMKLERLEKTGLYRHQEQLQQDRNQEISEFGYQVVSLSGVKLIVVIIKSNNCFTTRQFFIIFFVVVTVTDAYYFSFVV